MSQLTPTKSFATPSLKGSAASTVNVTLHREDFERLGLKAGESNACLIRQAAWERSHREDRFEEAGDEYLASIATSAYRLLDPRNRTSFYQRIQLSYPIDREERCDHAQPSSFTFSMVSNPFSSTTSVAS